MWIPRERRFRQGRDRDKFCYLLGIHLRWKNESDRIPDYIAESPDYLAAAETLIRQSAERYKYKIVDWMRVDPERLSIEAQAQVTESALKHV